MKIHWTYKGELDDDGVGEITAWELRTEEGVNVLGGGDVAKRVVGA